MKRSILVTLLALLQATPALAQPQPVSSQDTEALMEAMGTARACLARIDREALEESAERARLARDELRTLCRADDRDGAERRAVELGRAMADDPSLRSIMDCTAALPAGLKASGLPDVPDVEETKDDDAVHVCDSNL